VSLYRTVVLIPLLALAALGQAPASIWDNVKALAPGTEIRVAAGASKPIAGKLESVTDSGLVVRQGTATQSVPRPEIHSVAVKKKAHRVRKLLIGMGVGTAAGLGIGGALANDCRGIACEGFDVAVSGTIGLIGGAVAGIVWSREGWRQIYAQ